MIVLTIFSSNVRNVILVTDFHTAVVAAAQDCCDTVRIVLDLQVWHKLTFSGIH